MAIAVPFTTVVEMFLNLTDKYVSEKRPMLRYKSGGKYLPLSFHEVRERVALLHHGLARLGVKPGDRVAILSENRPEWVISDFACLTLGVVDVPIYPSQTAKQIEFILKDCSASVIIVSNQFQLTKVLKIADEVHSLKHIIVMNDQNDGGKHVSNFSRILESGKDEHEKRPGALRDLAKKIKPADLCTIIYTSGTTGEPKGVMLSHGNCVSNIKGMHSVVDINDRDVFLSFLPLCHVFERMGGYYTGMCGGGTIAYAENVDTVADNMQEIKPTIVCCVPRLFERVYNRIARKMEKESPTKRRIFYSSIAVGRRYVQAKKHGSISISLRFQHRLADKLVLSKLRDRLGGRIKFFISGGAALPRELGEFFETLGVMIVEGYGLTESSPVIAANRVKRFKFGTVGHALPDVEIKIAEDGEILARGPNIMMGYYNNKKATDEAIDKDGWLHTGDIGMMDEGGFLYITDRKKHLFVSSGGKNIAPQAIESLFSGNEFIDQFMLIGDKRMFLSALIVPDFQVLKEYADAHGIPYKTKADLVKNPELNKLIEQKIQATQKDLANFEKVRRFTLLEDPFTIDNGEMTPSLKIKRRAVEERYRELIDSMYQT